MSLLGAANQNLRRPSERSRCDVQAGELLGERGGHPFEFLVPLETDTAMVLQPQLNMPKRSVTAPPVEVHGGQPLEIELGPLTPGPELHLPGLGVHSVVPDVALIWKTAVSAAARFTALHSFPESPRAAPIACVRVHPQA